ncbi:type II toxin-antitoxin system HicB family antitoxin [Corynebacterium suedekumii]|uniref:Toxin-antitoxin system HicB family antitoxin n=1 Tax=Corynebacterium suedekumii TaxID=3049801 RepID=A0ABY8VII7_9CORY|nr:type II toxin-antitoxin system HicB family antitoxin [Corynebacterium suedekumii]WIM69480.1 toxin-antitoxin system HicB family antitoxin [Corynebacterium suedekumii]
MDINRYTYQVAWSNEDQEFVATVLEFPSLSWLAPDRQEAENGLVDLIAEIVADLQSTGEPVPTPLGERDYSGKFNVRTSPSLHRRLVLAARSEGISLNAYINQKLASA